LKGFEYKKAETIDEAVDLLQGGEEGEVRAIAGGTALVIMMKEKILTPKKLVDISKIDSMRKIAYDEKNGLTIGSMATHLEIEGSPLVRSRYPSLAEAFHTIGNVRIRATGTIGGNLAYAEPQCNPPTILAALGATINTRGPGGERSIPAEEFIRGIFESALEPGELITSVRVPPPRRGSLCSFYKFTTKSSTDKPTSTVAVYAEVDSGGRRATDCRIVVGAVGPKIYRCAKAEQQVKDTPLAAIDSRKVAEVAGGEFEVMDDLYGPGWYKKRVTESIIADTLKSVISQVGVGGRK